MSNLGASSVETQVVKVTGMDKENTTEQVVVEKALTIFLNGKEFATLVYTPSQEKELVLGFLCSEGIIRHKEQLKKINIDKREGIAWVDTQGEETLSENLFLKRYLTSCCGKGRSSFYFANDARLARKVDSQLRVTPQEISHYIKLLEEGSELFQRTGGVHEGAFASEGSLDYYAEDIGRHNVLDKLYGHAFIEGLDISQKVIVFSGRISSEILLKAAKMGCPILVGVSAPTDLALKLAEELGVTVVGFARQNRMNIYTCPQRITLLEQA